RPDQHPYATERAPMAYTVRDRRSRLGPNRSYFFAGFLRLFTSSTPFFAPTIAALPTTITSARPRCSSPGWSGRFTMLSTSSRDGETNLSDGPADAGYVTHGR